MTDTAPVPRRDRLHGRRRGRKLRAAQRTLLAEGLPKYLLDLSNLREAAMAAASISPGRPGRTRASG
jgi:hypothetical protein